MLTDYLWLMPILAIAAAGLILLSRRRNRISKIQSGLSPFDPDLLSKFRTAIPDVNARDRLMNHERKRSPHKTESELISAVLDAYYRDRRSGR